MPRRLVSPQNIAHALAQSLFYVPKGLVLPILARIDTSLELIAHHHVACAFCSLKLHPQRGAKSTFSKKAKNKFRLFQGKLQHFIEKLIHLELFILRKLLPRSWLDKLNQHRQQFFKLIQPRLKKVTDFLTRHQAQIVWSCLIPVTLILGCAWIYGLGIIPEIYAFLVASFWGGKILNHSANLIVHQQQSLEWKILKNVGKKFIGKHDETLFVSTKNEGVKLARRLIVEITLMNVIQKFPQFIGYCFQAFFSWLAFYMLVKTATNEAPSMIHKFEQRMKSSYPEPLHWLNQVDNALWLISYQTFKMTGSEKAQKKYNKLHESTHRERHSAKKSLFAGRANPF